MNQATLVQDRRMPKFRDVLSRWERRQLADRTYRRAIEAGAASIEEPMDMPHGDRRATVRDSWGNVWQSQLTKKTGDVAPSPRHRQGRR